MAPGPGPGDDRRVGARLHVKPPPLLAQAIELTRLPKVQIDMAGDAECRVLYDAFTRRHARWRLISNKGWGAALLALPERSEDYLALASRQLRRHAKQATKLGYTFRAMDPFEHVEEVLAINRSAAERQGRPMHPDYFDEQAVRRNFSHAGDAFGVFDRDGVLRAYITTRTCGDVAVMLRILGHGDALPDGVMHLLVAGTVGVLIDRHNERGRPSWLMYDMFPGGSDGLRLFKHAMGCRPYRVRWRWNA